MIYCWECKVSDLLLTVLAFHKYNNNAFICNSAELVNPLYINSTQWMKEFVYLAHNSLETLHYQNPKQRKLAEAWKPTNVQRHHNIMVHWGAHNILNNEVTKLSVSPYCSTVLLTMFNFSLLVLKLWLVPKLHVRSAPHCWLQHRLDSWYTCSLRVSPVSGGWPVNNYPLVHSNNVLTSRVNGNDERSYYFRSHYVVQK